MSFLFGTVGAPISTPKKPGGSVGAVLQTQALGLGAFELGWVHSVRVSEVTCAAIKQTARNAGIALSIHAPYFINLNTSEDQWPAHRKRIIDAGYYGWLAGATDIIFHPGSYFGSNDGSPLTLAKRRLRECLKQLDDLGASVTLRPETMGKSSLLGSLDDALAMSEDNARITPCLDIAHLFARTAGKGYNDAEAFTTLLDTYASQLGKKALQSLHIHISGIAYSNAGERHHLPLDESEFNYKSFLLVLKNTACAGRMLCESPIMEDDALRLQCYWESL